MKNSDRQKDNPSGKNIQETRAANNIRSSNVSQVQGQMSFAEEAVAPPKQFSESEGAKVTFEPKTITKTPANSIRGAYAIVETETLLEDTNKTKSDGKAKTTNSREQTKSKTDKELKSSKGGAAVVVDKELLSIPQTNFAIGLLVMCCFNPPFGLLALYFSLRAAAAYRDGDNAKGAWCARTSIVISLLGIMLTMVIISSVVLYIAVNKHSSKRGYRLMSSSSLGF